ncbi:hypothetical protein DM44_1866 [Burkholderia cepacia]|jgi:hypothetical protein|uniref:Uncharacterized protein n=1 Tax=Achromobacter insolitus TaxID=217204 RepID=A0A6S7EUM5_9BURK|nr:hypothetical protein DM42_2068 [Burkholderia cepacia]CAB3928975.1 hypothetical protein LMG6000_00027 [Achromobacter insolitus]CAB5514866.1 hypothetical protein LMG26857_03926 [Achromobacter anxifer]CAJ0724649.1 hypothetical protein R77592_00386 [Ralstonia mannitolilytica]CUJ38788.1 Uncharacterised protein [Achromobacter xylosoxidans]GLZ74900.1 hypothetical protein Bcon01_79450 [Burkholderia contaminans]
MTNDLDRLTENVCVLAQPVTALPSVQPPTAVNSLLSAQEPRPKQATAPVAMKAPISSAAKLKLVGYLYVRYCLVRERAR